MKNRYLKVLDLSFNQMGQQIQFEGAKSFAALFTYKQSDLMHLDISNNNFNLEECKLIQAGISQN